MNIGARCTILAFLILLVSVASISAQSLPRLHLLYPTVLDDRCSQFTKNEVESEWLDEATRRRPEFQALWDKSGPTYLKAAMSEVGLPFPYRDMQAYLTVRTDGTAGSMSMPLLLHLGPFLASTSKIQGPRWPLWYFAEVAFHELMHHYVLPVTEVSALRRKYGTEVPQVLNHLHVMALEKVVLSKLRLSNELKFLDEDYRTNSGPNYKRAWEIVNDIEREQAFIGELQLLPGAKNGHR